MNSDISTIHNCTNCGCCVASCPAKAITVQAEGLFYHPAIDDSKCTQCGLCIEYCPLRSSKQKTQVLRAYGCWNKECDVVLKSSSGGVFSTLASCIISQGGIAFGAAYTGDYKKVVFDNTDHCKLVMLQKSKYVESLVVSSFEDVKNELADGRKVLFCGTPCQVAGLKSYLSDEYENLLTCDFACGGLASHKCYEQHIEFLEKKYNSKVISVDFRPKTHGWKRYAISVEFENGKRYNVLGTEDNYLRLFLYKRYTIRESCFSCRFREYHAADITLADFWRHREFFELYNEDGISLVLCNTEKGLDAMDQIRDNLVIEELHTDGIDYNNTPIEVDDTFCSERTRFLQSCERAAFDLVCESKVPVPAKKRIKSMISRIISRNRG